MTIGMEKKGRVIEAYGGKENNNNNDDDDKNKKWEVILTIKDTGAGIDPDVFPKLFSKFAAVTSATGGNGLGLFISKGMVEGYGQRIIEMVKKGQHLTSLTLSTA